MQLKARIALTLICMAGCTASMFAHHSLSAEFDVNKPVSLIGTMTKVEWANPHALFFLDVNDVQMGKAVTWVLQLPSPNMLSRRGWSREPFKSGIFVTVNGYIAKDGSRKGSVQSVSSSGGRLLFTVDPEPVERTK